MFKSKNKKTPCQVLSATISNEKKTSRSWWTEAISVITISYLIFSLIGPMFIKPEHQVPRRIETPDIVLIALVLIFNSGLIGRLEDFGVSQSNGVTAKFGQLKREVDEQKRQIDELQAQQLEQLEQQQKNLEEIQAFMYNFLLGKKDYEKIEQLEKHSKANTNYEFYVSSSVGDELRRLRDFKLVETKTNYISDIVQASDYGKRAIDLTQYLTVTDLGRQFLETRETLQAKIQQDTVRPQHSLEVE